MSERGVFAVDRGIFDHPEFKPEPYTEREAWLWLCGEAAFREKRVRVGGNVIALARGQLAHSERFMASKWKWSKSRVHRFLGRLKSGAMLNLETDHETNLITICNYEKYAFGRTSSGPVIEPQSGPAADQQRTKEEEGKKERVDIVRSGGTELFAPSPKGQKANGIDPLFAEFYSAYPRRQSKQDAIKAYAQVRRSGVSHETIMRGLEAAKRSDSRFREQRFTPLPASWLRAGGFEDDTSSATSHQSLERMLLA